MILSTTTVSEDRQLLAKGTKNVWFSRTAVVNL